MTLSGYSAAGNIYQWHNFLVCQKTECGQTKMTLLFKCFSFQLITSSICYNNSSNNNKDITENNEDNKSNKNDRNNKSNKNNKNKKSNKDKKSNKK